MFLSVGCLSFVCGFVVIRLRNVRASVCFHSFSICSSDGLWMRIWIFSPLFIGFRALTCTIRICVS